MLIDSITVKINDTRKKEIAKMQDTREKKSTHRQSNNTKAELKSTL